MIFKRKHTGSFAVIPRATADDEQLSADALGALVYLLARPDMGRVTTEDLQARFKIGKARAEGLFKEIGALGYAELDGEPV